MSLVDAMRITAKEYAIILEAMREKYGLGYSEILEIGRLQAKLSIMAEVAQKMEQIKEN